MAVKELETRGLDALPRPLAFCSLYYCSSSVVRNQGSLFVRTWDRHP